MQWGTFGSVHLISLVLGAVITIALYFLLKHRSKTTQIIVLGILSFAGIAAIIYNLVAWDSPLEYLPFHLCSLNAMVLPFAVFSRNKYLGNLLLLWSLGALAALVLNTSVAEAEITSWVFVFYYFPHVLEFGIPLILFKLGLVELDKKCIWSTTAITLCSYIAIHFINLELIEYCGSLDLSLSINYMFSISPDGNPLLMLFWQIIPYKFWYMLLCIPVAVVYLVCVYYTYDVYKLVRYGKNEKISKE